MKGSLSGGSSEKRDVEVLATLSCSFANLLTGNKLGCKIFRSLTGHAFEGLNSSWSLTGNQDRLFKRGVT